MVANEPDHARRFVEDGLNQVIIITLDPWNKLQVHAGRTHATPG